MVIEKQNICDENYAAIDIGSNAVRLLIKHLDEDEPEVKVLEGFAVACADASGI